MDHQLTMSANSRIDNLRFSKQHTGKWIKLITVVGSAQVVVQVLGFISGILVIRLLSTHEYAFYTLANTMLGTMTLLADGGIATGVMSQGGKVWQDKQKLGAVIVAGMELRKKFAVSSLLVAVPILFYLLHKHDASWLMSTLIVLSLIPAFYTSLYGTLLEIAPKLKQDIASLQKIQVISNVGRLALLGLTLFIYPLASVAIACAGVSQLWSSWRLLKISNRYADRSQPADPLARQEILRIVKRALPNTIFYCISGQVTVWIISLFGSTFALAEMGALGRLSMVFNFANVLFSTLIVPRFARLSNDSKKYLMVRFIQIQGGLVIFNVLAVLATWVWSTNILWILGEEYAKLTNEIVVLSACGAMGLMSTLTYQLSISRGVVVNPLAFISIMIVVQVGALFLVDVSSVMGVLIYSLLFVVFEFLIRMTYIIKHFLS